jgi:RNA polymerase sigma factor (TIGR02999 family)
LFISYALANMPPHMPEPIPADVTQLLEQWSGGDREALDEIIPLVYDELRRMARGHMAQERAGHTIQATALVNEVYLKMKNERGSNWTNRAQFFAIAAQMMRRILVDHARQHSSAKRGGGAQQVTLEDAMLVSKDNASEMLAIDEALGKLEQLDQRKSQVAVMRFFAGLTVEETAEALAISIETVARDWRFARAWLRNELGAAA